MNRPHPSRQRLRRWLDDGDSRRTHRRVEAHIVDCDHCQSALDQLTELDDDLVADLQLATSPPSDLAVRTHEGVDDRLRNEAAIGALLDLFTIGWDVTRTILDPTTDGDNPHPSEPSADEATGGTR